MDNCFEAEATKCGSLTELRAKAAERPEFRTTGQCITCQSASDSSVRAVGIEQWKFQAITAATSQEIDTIWSMITGIDTSINPKEKLKIATLKVSWKHLLITVV